MATNRWVSTGSGDYGSAANWSLAAVPVDTDDVVFDNTSVYDVTGSLNQSAMSGAYASFTVKQGYTGKIGDATNYLRIKSATAEIGRDIEGLRSPGSPRLNLDFGSTTACAIVVMNTAMLAADYGYMPCRIKAAHSSTTLRMRRGKVSIAALAGETSTIDDIDLGEPGATTENCVLVLGAGVTMDDLNLHYGKMVTASAIDAANVRGGLLVTEGAATIAALAVTGSGRVISNSTGTITAATLDKGGSLDTREANGTRTISTLTISGPCTFAQHPRVTVTTFASVPTAPRTFVVTEG